jgi:hypothetical protein
MIKFELTEKELEAIVRTTAEIGIQTGLGPECGAAEHGIKTYEENFGSWSSSTGHIVNHIMKKVKEGCEQ